MLKALLKFIRPRILVTCYAIAFLGATVVGSITFKTILILLVLILWYIHAASVNDYSDRHIDAINLKNPADRPLLTHDASNGTVWLIHSVAGVLAVAFSAFYGFWAVVFTAGMLIVNYAYSLKPVRISDRGILSQFLLAFAYVYYPFTLGFWSGDSRHTYPWLLSIGIYLAFIARLLLKDFRDVKGDKKHGKITFVLQYGVKTTCAVSAFFWFIALATVAYAVSFSPGVAIVLLVGLVQVCMFLYMLAKSANIQSHVSMVALIAKAANITLITLLIRYLIHHQIHIASMEANLINALPGLSFLGLNFFRGIGWKRVYNVH